MLDVGPQCCQPWYGRSLPPRCPWREHHHKLAPPAEEPGSILVATRGECAGCTRGSDTFFPLAKWQHWDKEAGRTACSSSGSMCRYLKLNLRVSYPAAGTMPLFAALHVAVVSQMLIPLRPRTGSWPRCDFVSYQAICYLDSGQTGRKPARSGAEAQHDPKPKSEQYAQAWLGRATPRYKDGVRESVLVRTGSVGGACGVCKPSIKKHAGPSILTWLGAN